MLLTRLLHDHWRPALVSIAIFCVGYPFLNHMQAPMRFTGGTVHTPNVQRGTDVVMAWTQEWSYGCSGTSTRTIVDSDGHQHSVEGLNVTPPARMGQRTSPSRGINIPAYWPTGTTRMWTSIDFTCGPLGRKFMVRSPTLEFEVVK